MERPLYRSLATRLERRIAEGRYPIGSQLPSEPVLEQEFGVSRITIRQALSMLKRRGLLASRSGIGTVVRAGAANSKSMTVSGSIRDLIYYAAGTRYTPLGHKLVVPPPSIGALLDLSAKAKAFCFRGIRSRPHGGPFGLEEVYIPEPLGDRLDNSELGGRTLFSLLEEENDLKIAEVEQIITAIPPLPDIAKKLGLTARAPVLKAMRIYRLADGRPVEVAITFYNVAKFEYVMKLLPD
jgi:GntR family transcriptional regulator